MALNATCTAYTGRLLRVAPFYGWGWCEYDANGRVSYSQDQSAGPPPFFLRVEYFYTYAAALIGAVGRVEELEHPLHEFFAAFYLKLPHGAKPVDFSDNINSYVIQLGPDSPCLLDPPSEEEADWPHWKFEGWPYLGGYALIGENDEAIARYYERLVVRSRTSSCLCEIAPRAAEWAQINHISQLRRYRGALLRDALGG